MSVAIIPSDITVKPIVDRILQQDCPFVYGGPCPPYGYPYGQGYPATWTGGYAYGYPSAVAGQGPVFDYWGSNPCQLQKLQEILAMLNSLLSPLPREVQLNLLNQAVFTFVPAQGNTEITLLEAAIVMRWPGLVAQLLRLGASPNVTTSGISLVAQLLQALPMDATEGHAAETQAIIDLLLQSGSLVPPGFPGTQGYLPEAIRRGYPYVV